MYPFEDMFRLKEPNFLARHIESRANILSRNELKQHEVCVNKASRTEIVFCIRFLETTVACGNRQL